jgi:hypothetical protein
VSSEGWRCPSAPNGVRRYGCPYGYQEEFRGTRSERTNKIFVREAFDTLFNKRDYAAAERFWSEHYIQHSAYIPPGREGLFGLIKPLPKEYSYEPALIMAEDDMVMPVGPVQRPWAWAITKDRLRHSSHGRWADHGALGRH